MQRQEYINLRKQNSSMIIWNYYLEKCTKQNVKPLINSHNELLMFLNIWVMQTMNSIENIFENITTELDNKFTIIKLFNKEKQLIDIL
jgi:hypothetical protein